MNALFEYRNSLDALRFTPEQKAALAAGAADAAKGKTRRRPLWRTALIAACLTAALAVGAGASGVLKSAVEVFAPIFGGSATAEFEDLCVWDEAQEAPTPVVEGHWKFRFDVDYEDSSVTLGGGETFTQNGMTFTVDAITLSPVAVKVDYTVDHEVQWSDAPSGRLPAEDSRQMERYFENVEILLTKTGGTVIDLSASGGSLKPENGVTVCGKGQVFEELLPLEELESIRVGAIVYPISGS